MSTGLIVVGGALQVFGVALVFIDIHRIRRRIAAYLHRPQTTYGALAVGLAPDTSNAVGSTGSVPTVHQRLDAVEKRLANLPGEWRRDDERVLDLAQSAANSRLEGVARSTRGDVDDLAGLVLDLQPGAWWRSMAAIGAVLIIVGVTAATIGSLPGTSGTP